MNKMFSNKVFLQITSVVLLIISVNLFILNRNSNKYVYERVDRDLKKAITELEDINEVVFDMYMQGNFKKDYKIDTEYIFALDRQDREIEKIYSIEHGPFNWFGLDFITFNIIKIKDKGNLNKEDEEYLKGVHKYNKQLIKAYYKVLNDNEMRVDQDDGKLKKIYKEFIIEANKISGEKEYSKLREYKVKRSETITENEEHKVSLEEAKKLTTEVLEKIFNEKPAIIEEEDYNEDEYEFYNKWEDGKDKNLYSISIGKKDGSFMMYRRSQLTMAVLSEDNLDKKAREIKDIVVPKDYICYEREKMFREGKLYAINYNFIRKVDNVYDESHKIEIGMNCYGYLSDLRISDPLNYKKVNIEEPKVVKKYILSKLAKGDIKNVILAQNKDGKLEYRVFIELNKELYTYTFDANTEEQTDYRKSDRMYFERVSDI
ncbi:hypothetical protein [Tepidibacter aestuarii]|uniref:hypothetical protein n=1 Tax=Tepidibacter aestuarii TaxID=2925782 RepID=UPI0020C098AE|nr:hypothetical protein [Tepidibacter aestuarii]CAH2214204.1 conserved protein of unknown function [Tepidibacter aestuarii]